MYTKLLITKKMTRKIAAVALLSWTLFHFQCNELSAAPTGGDYASYVNPMVGTDFHGHTFPGAAYPFGMIQLSPDTRPKTGDWDGCSGYHYSDEYIYGFSHTHLSGTGCDDLCDILLMPVRDYKGGLDNSLYRSRFSHGNETAEPGFYKIFLDTPRVSARVTVGRRIGLHEYSYEGEGSKQLIIDLKHRDQLRGSRIAQVDDYCVEGYRISKSWADNQHEHFFILFDQPISEFKAYGNEGALISFGDKSNTVTARVSLSSVSEDNARENLLSEGAASSINRIAPRAEAMPGFEFMREQARAEWNSYLSKIEVSGGSEEQLTTFYTALYHTAIHPSLLSDANGEYRGMDGQVHNTEGKFDRYTVFSIWDTFRALHPLFTIIERNRTLDFLKTFQSIYDEGGKLPIWELNGYETNCMIGFNSVSVIVDAFVKGIDGFDYAKMFEAMVESSKKHEFGLDSFYRDGAVLADHEHESVSKTLEYAYDCWCIWRMANQLQQYGQNDSYDIIADEYYAYAQQWRSIFDPSTGFMRPRLNGRWLTPFDPREVNNHFTEANSWQYSFFVPQDIYGHIEALGGPEKYIARLDGLFTANSQTTGRTQSDITGLIGQYAHGNEPSHHIPYLYNFAGQPWKTQERVREILTTLYTSAPDGLCGNEDCGQMSAWYVMSALGIYDVCPGSGQLSLTSPLFDYAVIHLENGKDFSISAPGASEGKLYISSASLDGNAYSKSWIDHSDIMAGKSLIFKLSDKAMKNSDGSSRAFGIAEEDRPVSKMEQWIITAPSIDIENDVINGPATVRINNITWGGYSEYAIVSTEEADRLIAGEIGTGVNFQRYRNSFTIDESCTILAHNVANGQLSAMTRTDISRVKREMSIDVQSRYNPQYNAGGDEGLIDGRRGNENWRTGGWQGYQDTDFTAIVDLGSVKDISLIGAGFCQDARSWIWMPRYVEFYVASEDKEFRKVGRIDSSTDPEDYEVQTHDISLSLSNSDGSAIRYIKVFAKNFGTIPEWHPGHGGEGFIFIDEIWVK